MPGEVDNLILNAVVLDNFSDALDRLSRKLVETDAQAEKTDPINIDANIAKAFTKLEAIEQQADSIDDDINIDVDTDRTPALPAGRRRRALPAPGMLDTIDDDRRGGLAMAMTSLIPGGMGGRTFDADEREGKTLRELMGDFGELRLTMGRFMNILAAFIPLFGVFVGALPAAIAGLGALAAGLITLTGVIAGVIGLGLGGMMTQGGQLNVKELRLELEELKETFMEAFGPVMDALGPLMAEIFTQIQFIMRDIGSRASILLRLTDEIGAAFQWIANVIGPAFTDAVLFAEALAPVMAFIAGGTGDIQFFRLFADIIVDTLPLLAIFVGHLMNLLASIYEISLGFFVVATAVTAFFAIMLDLFSIIPFGLEGLGAFIALVLVAVTVTSLWSLATTGIITRMYTLVVSALPSVVQSLFLYIETVAGATAANLVFIASVSLLLGVLTFGLAPALGVAGAGFTNLGSNISSATDQLRQFANQSGNIDGPQVSGVSGGAGQSYPSSGGMTVVAPDQETGNAVVNTANFTGRNSNATDGDNVSNRQHD